MSDGFIYFWCFLTLGVAAVLFFPLFIFFACIAGIIAIAALIA